jgi:hypothetical protein
MPSLEELLMSGERSSPALGALEGLFKALPAGAGYFGGQEYAQGQEDRASIRDQLEKQRQRQAQFEAERAALGPGATPEAMSGLALKYAGPQDLLKYADDYQKLAEAKKQREAQQSNLERIMGGQAAPPAATPQGSPSAAPSGGLTPVSSPMDRVSQLKQLSVLYADKPAAVTAINREIDRLESQKDEWGDPYQMSGATVQKNKKTGQIRTVVPASIAGGGTLSQDATKLIAEQYLAGDPRAIVGYARNQTAKIALQNEIAKQAKENGMDGRLLAATMAEFEGFRSGQRTVGTRQAQLAIAADVTSQFVPIAIDRSKDVNRSEFKTLNDIQYAIQRRTASPELRRFEAANNALINVYARAINPQGVATVSDKDHAREVLSTAFSKGDYAAGANQLKVEVDTELRSPGSVKRRMRSEFTDQAEPQAPIAAPAQGGWRVTPVP